MSVTCADTTTPALAGQPLEWRKTRSDGGRHWLDGRPISCGTRLELQLPGGVWLPVRYETESRSRFIDGRRPCARCGQGDTPGGRVWAHQECPPRGTVPAPPREHYTISVLYCGLGHRWERRFEVRLQASIDADGGPRCGCPAGSSRYLASAVPGQRFVQPDGTCGACGLVAPDDVLVKAVGIRGTWRIWDRQLGAAVDCEHETPDEDDPEERSPTWPEAERDRFAYRASAEYEAEMLQCVMAPCPQAPLYPPSGALLRWPEASR